MGGVKRNDQLLSCFKAYDIRGQVPDQLNDDIAYRLGRAYGQFMKSGTVVVGRDVRLSSPGIAASLTRGLTESGSDVIDIGLCGTEEVYFHNDADEVIERIFAHMRLHTPKSTVRTGLVSNLPSGASICALQTRSRC